MVWCFLLMSSALLGFLSSPGQARAHELRPAVAEVSVSEDRIEISLRLAVETLLAGIDQSQVADTDEAPEAEVYDRLRGLPDRVLAQMVEKRFSDPGGRRFTFCCTVLLSYLRWVLPTTVLFGARTLAKAKAEEAAKQSEQQPQQILRMPVAQPIRYIVQPQPMYMQP